MSGQAVLDQHQRRHRPATTAAPSPKINGSGSWGPRNGRGSSGGRSRSSGPQAQEARRKYHPVLVDPVSSPSPPPPPSGRSVTPVRYLSDVCVVGDYVMISTHVSVTDPILSRPCQLLLPTLILWGMVEEHPPWLPNYPEFRGQRLPLRVTHQQQPHRVSRLSRGQARQCQAPERTRRTWARPCASSVYPRRSRERTSGHRDKTLECWRTLRRLSGVLWGPAMGIWKEVGRWQCD